MIKAQPSYPTLDVVVAVTMAYKANGNKVEKNDVPAVQADNYRTGSPAITSNKTLAIGYLDFAASFSEQDREDAKSLVSYLQQKNMLDMFTGKTVNSFSRDLLAALEKETTLKSGIGLLVWAANSYFTGLARDAVTEKTSECAFESKPLGQVGDKITVNFTWLEDRYIPQLGCFDVYGTDDNHNLVSFLTKHEHLVRSGKFTAKVKNAANDKWHRNAMVTSLNFVKAAEKV
jgi:hypothetical protein